MDPLTLVYGAVWTMYAPLFWPILAYGNTLF